MNEFGAFGVWVSTHMALSAAVVGAVALIFRHRPTVRHAVGLVGLAAMLLAPFLVGALPETVRPVVARNSPPPAPSFATTGGLPSPIALVEPVAPAPEIAFTPVFVPTASSVPPDSPSASFAVQHPAPSLGGGWWRPATLVPWAIGVWLSGVVALLIRWCLARRKLARLTASLVPCAIDAETSEVVRQAAGLSRLPPILASREIPVPVVIGHRRPVVAIPEALVRSGDRAALRDVLIHECAHVARRDPWVHLVQRCAAVLYWPHPGVHGVNAIISRSREEICDNHVLTASQPVEFARTLLEMSERLVGVRMVPAPLGLLGTRWSLESRVEGLLDPRRKVTTRTRPSGLVAVAVLFTLLGGMLGGVRRIEADPPVDQSAATDIETDDENGIGRMPELARKSFAVRGRVVLNGKPVEGAEVQAFTFAEGNWTVVAKVMTDAEGNYLTPEIPLPRRGELRIMPMLAATRAGNVTALEYMNLEKVVAVGPGDPVVIDLAIGEKAGALTGIVVDGSGKPVAGADVFTGNIANKALPGVHSAKTDALGRFRIDGLKCWKSGEEESVDTATGLKMLIGECALQATHPSFAKSLGWYSAVPQNVHITMQTAVVVRGIVVDEVTGKPVAKALVEAQGVARSGWFETSTDENGRFQLSMHRDHYNIWAVMKDRMPVAVKALRVEPGHETPEVQIRMVRGGFVTGRVLEASGKPISLDPKKREYVAHYGPARPSIGAAVTVARVQPDGSYRMHVAPGSNKVYLMTVGRHASALVDVGDGQEVHLDLIVGQTADDYDDEDPDRELDRRLHREAEEERRAGQEQARTGARAAPKPATPPKPGRADTPVGRLLNRLETQNSGRSLFTDRWLRTLKEIVDLGPDAVPDLIAELDATSNDMMLRCLGFTLRAIGDKRAIPALIRTIPKTLLPPGSDMGLKATDKELAKFAQKHDLDPRDTGLDYGFGRPVREVLGALQSLSGTNFDDERVYHIFDGGTERHRYLKQRLFHNQAITWEGWWKEHGAALVADAAYREVRLPPAPVAPPVPVPSETTPRKAVLQESNAILSPPNGTTPYTWEFFDLDTGRATVLPKRFHGRGESPEVREWAIGEGYDLMGGALPAQGTEPPVHVIRPLKLAECRELPDGWWKQEKRTATLKELRDLSKPAGEFLPPPDRVAGPRDPKGTWTYLFQTVEGTVGLLYVGVDVQDDTLKEGGVSEGDDELNPVAFFKGRRFAPSWLVENGAKED